jgi:hypothetical protein
LAIIYLGDFMIKNKSFIRIDFQTWCPETLGIENLKENKSVDNYESMDKKIIIKVPKDRQLQLIDPPLL